MNANEHAESDLLNRVTFEGTWHFPDRSLLSPCDAIQVFFSFFSNFCS